jgi:Leucine-rich repeat (LRR) protein
VASLRRLKRLDVSGNPLVSLLDLQGLVELEAVNASATLIAKTQVLPSLERLRRLELASCPLENLEDIERYTDLRHLDVSGTRVKRLKPAEKLMELRTLKIFNTRISAKEAAGFKRLHPECEVIHY